MTIAGLWRSGNWQHVAMGCTSLVKFNALKSNIIHMGPRCCDISTELFVDSIAIPCANRVKYLGIYLMSARNVKVCSQQPKNKFLEQSMDYFLSAPGL